MFINPVSISKNFSINSLVGKSLYFINSSTIVKISVYNSLNNCISYIYILWNNYNNSNDTDSEQSNEIGFNFCIICLHKVSNAFYDTNKLGLKPFAFFTAIYISSSLTTSNTFIANISFLKF